MTLVLRVSFCSSISSFAVLILLILLVTFSVRCRFMSIDILLLRCMAMHIGNCPAHDIYQIVITKARHGTRKFVILTASLILGQRIAKGFKR